MVADEDVDEQPLLEQDVVALLAEATEPPMMPKLLIVLPPLMLDGADVVIGLPFTSMLRVRGV